jgi:vacuolar protein sorting-associated protein 35
MQKAIAASDLMEAIKHAATMLAELRTALLSPKNYYALYMASFEQLQRLEAFFKELVTADEPKYTIQEIYDLVQRAGNIVPRLYLLITAGSVFMSTGAAPTKEILSDLVEMCRGVQHPVRGLFVRAYLNQLVKDKLPEAALGVEDPNGNTQDAIDFVVHNFLEMNKLWVRLQHQNIFTAADKRRRERERSDLKLLVGTNLVRLSQMEGLTSEAYKADVLPRILQQVITCKDRLAQEYLLDVIINVFADDFHLATLDQLLAALAEVRPDVALPKVIISLLDRLSQFLATEEGRALATEMNYTNAFLPAGISQEAVAGFEALDAEVRICAVLSSHVTALITHSASTVTLIESLNLLRSLLDLSMSAFPSDINLVLQAFTRVHEVLQARGDIAATLSQDAPALKAVRALLDLPLESFSDPLVVVRIPAYSAVLECLPTEARRAQAINFANAIIEKSCQLSEPETADRVLSYLSPIVLGPNPSENVSEPNDDGVVPPCTQDEDDIAAEQELVCRVVLLVEVEDTDILCEALDKVRSHLQAGGLHRMRHTLQALLTNVLRAAQRVSFREAEGATVKVSSTHLFRFAREIVDSLKVFLPRQALSLALFSARAASQCGQDEETYEFVSEALLIYEEDVSDSKHQLLAIRAFSSTLYDLRALSESNYDRLATKVAQHAGKLLRKPDQCRAVANAARLYWRTADAEGRGEFKDSARVMQCLKRALSTADHTRDAVLRCRLFVDVLNAFVLYFQDVTPGSEGVDIAEHQDFLRALLALIDGQVSELDPSASEAAAAAVAYYTNTTEHLRRCISNEASSELFAGIELSA